MDKRARVIAHLTVCVGVAESESQERVLVPVEIVRDALELLKAPEPPIEGQVRMEGF